MRFLDAGESHGRFLTAIVEGMPSNIQIDVSKINYELERRQKGFGRGGRMSIERDEVEIVSGISLGKTTGAPITLIIRNRDYENWKETLSDPKRDKMLRPRPGHGDLNGIIKYDLDDIRDVLERASARETAVRTAVGALASIFLGYFNITVKSRVVQIGNVKDDTDIDDADFKYAEASDMMCSNETFEETVIEEIKKAKDKGDTLGGKFEVIVENVPPGIGSYSQWDRKLDGKLAGALMSIQGIKMVEIGGGGDSSGILGSKFHDEIYYSNDIGYYRKSNNAGGIEAGISNGEDIIIRATMKPIPTLKIPLASVDISTKEPNIAAFERSDICAVPSASVVARNVCMWEIACAFLDKFGGDSIGEILESYQRYMEYLKEK